jgi:hypothetical protein
MRDHTRPGAARNWWQEAANDIGNAGNWGGGVPAALDVLVFDPEEGDMPVVIEGKSAGG